MDELPSWRTIASSSINSGAIGIGERNQPKVYLWGSNNSSLVPYLPDNLELDTPHDLELGKIFKDELALPQNYKIVDIQLTESLCYILVEEHLPKSLFEDLKKMRKHVEQYSSAVKTDNQVVLFLRQQISKGDLEQFFFFFSHDLTQMVDLLDIGLRL